MHELLDRDLILVCKIVGVKARKGGGGAVYIHLRGARRARGINKPDHRSQITRCLCARGAARSFEAQSDLPKGAWSGDPVGARASVLAGCGEYKYVCIPAVLLFCISLLCLAGAWVAQEELRTVSISPLAPWDSVGAADDASASGRRV
jgi:hypothetical protein